MIRPALFVSILLAVFALSSVVRADEGETRFVAVMEMQNTASDRVTVQEVYFLTDALRKAATDAVDRRILSVMTRETMDALVPPETIKCLAGQCLVTIGKRLQATYVVGGSIKPVGNQIGITIEAYESASGRLEVSEVLMMKTVVDAVGQLREKAPALMSRLSQLAGGTASPVALPVPATTYQPAPSVQSGGPQIESGTIREAYGDLTIDAKPRGLARLDVVDPTGKTEAFGAPYKNPQAKVGRWTVRASATGYESQEQTVYVPTDEITVKRIELLPLGALEVTGKPEGAQVRVTGPGGFAHTGGLPWRASGLPRGEYQVEVSRTGYSTDKKDVTVNPGQPTTLTVDLPKEGQSGPAGQGWVSIPAGQFQIGSPDSESGRGNDEGPVHTVRVTRSFLMMTHEVTQGEYKALMGKNPSSFSSCGDNCPVENVSWYDAVASANAMSRRDHLPECYGIDGINVKFVGLNCRGYRLPTEGEWEYAARAGTTGDRYADIDRVAWYNNNGGGKTHPVGKKAPNAWGLYDMLGNVMEWVQDWYGVYSSGAEVDPQGPSSGSYRVLRGGSWYYVAVGVRAASRDRYDPGGRFYGLGFRLVRSN